MEGVQKLRARRRVQRMEQNGKIHNLQEKRGRKGKKENASVQEMCWDERARRGV
jgi:hypothetical protein